MNYYLYRLDFENEKIYFGITKNPERRYREHIASSRLTKCPQVVHRAIKKCLEKVKMTVLVIGSKDYIRELEKKVIAEFNARDPKVGYNIAMGGEISPVAGVGHTAASRAKMSKSQKRRIHSPEEVAKMRSSLMGRVFSPEHKQKLSKASFARWARRPEPDPVEEPTWLSNYKALSKEV